LETFVAVLEAEKHPLLTRGPPAGICIAGIKDIEIVGFLEFIAAVAQYECVPYQKKYSK
jgi:hypothetical protein